MSYSIMVEHLAGLVDRAFEPWSDQAKYTSKTAIHSIPATFSAL